LRFTENAKRLLACSDFGEIFELVKTAADKSLGMHRAGLTLVLGDLPNSVGAYHELGSNSIVMNRNLVKIVWELSESQNTRNSYVFMILLHEYLHTLGYTSDRQVRNLGKEISDQYLGRRHLASEMAVRPLDHFFPDMEKLSGFRDKGEYQTVRRFDSSSTPYIA
jgi:hypothetical protein